VRLTGVETPPSARRTAVGCSCHVCSVLCLFWMECGDPRSKNQIQRLLDLMDSHLADLGSNGPNFGPDSVTDTGSHELFSPGGKQLTSLVI
jgi:hypothetical protein